MAIYFSRSRSIVTAATAYTHVEMELNIYYGTQTTDRATGTTLNLKAKAIGGNVDFDVAPYIKDFIDPTFNYTAGNIYGTGCWVDYRTRGYTPGVGTGTYSSYVSREYTKGYKLPGENNNTTRQLLMEAGDGQVYIHPTGYNVTVPLNRNNWSNYTFNGDGTYSPGYVGTTTTSNFIVSYFTADKSTYTDFAGMKIETIPYNTNYRSTPIRISFMNRWGAYQQMWFMGGKRESTDVTGSTYSRYVSDGAGTLVPNKHSKVDYGKNGAISVTLYSGWQPEGNNSWFQQLLMSESIFIHDSPLNGVYSNLVYPARINQNRIDFKSREKDRMIQYSIQFEYSLEIIA